MYSRVFFGVEQEKVNNTNIIQKNCRNKPEGRKTALAGASLFTSHLLEIQTWTCLLPVLIRNLFSRYTCRIGFVVGRYFELDGGYGAFVEKICLIKIHLAGKKGESNKHNFLKKSKQTNKLLFILHLKLF